MITGVSGGEFGIRGRVTAFDATTGKEVWRFYTIPGPGEIGHDTWPATATRGSTAARRSGRRRRSIRSSGCSTSRPATPARTTTAAGARATTSSPRRSSPSTCKTGKLQVALPDGAPRHLGLRRAEPDHPLRRDDRRHMVHGDRRGREDRLALPARPRRTASRSSRSPRSRCRRTRTRRRRRRSRSRATRRSSRTCRRRAVRGRQEGRARRREGRQGAADDREGQMYTPYWKHA